MLVLTRFKGESIMIGDDVRITVMDVRGSKVRLGIEAPSETAVHRQEIWLKINGESNETEV